jgi:hypothetical protein
MMRCVQTCRREPEALCPSVVGIATGYGTDGRPRGPSSSPKSHLHAHSASYPFGTGGQTAVA